MNMRIKSQLIVARAKFRLSKVKFNSLAHSIGVEMGRSKIVVITHQEAEKQRKAG